MDTRIIFAALAVITLGLGVDIGNDINFYLHQENAWKGVISISTLVFLPMGTLALIEFYRGTTNSLKSQFSKLLATYGGAQILSSLCFGAIYGIIVGPFWHEEPWAWADGWAIFALIGILPTVLSLNEIVRERRRARKCSPDNVKRFRQV